MRHATLFTLIACLLLPCAAQAAPPAASPAPMLETLHRFDKCPPEGCEMAAEGGAIRFYPQSLHVDGDRLLLMNRHEPALAVLRLESPKGEFVVNRLDQPSDAKFSARFFTDIGAIDGSLFAMEQSTATLRQVRELKTGPAMGDVFAPSDAEGQTIEKFFPLGGSRVLLLDSGTKRALVRDLDEIRDSVAPDATGLTFAYNGVDALVSAAGLVTLEKDGGTLEALLTPVEETEEIALLSAWTGEAVRALDADAEGRFLFYVETSDGARIERFDAAKRPFAAERFACPKLVFAREATRVARSGKDGALLLLLEEGDAVVVARLAFQAK